jgi:predicted enzyme related to lactoylglutathione lyase
MPKRETTPAGAPCWIDLMTSDPAASKAFYGELFGWTAEDSGPEFGGYITFSKDGATVAGAMANDPAQGVPDGWSVYLAVFVTAAY